MNLLEAYRYLDALAQQRHFGRAAQACHITQPALSNALRALEEHLGVSIVRRGRSFEGLTAEGELVLAGARRLLHEQEVLRQELRGDAAQPHGSLVIGAVPTAVPIAARFASRLVARHPGIRPQVRSLSSQEVESGLDSLALDLGLGYIERIDALGRGKVDTWSQYVEQHFLVCRSGQRGGALRFGRPIGWAEASTLKLCALGSEMHNRTILDRAFATAGTRLEPVIETNSVMALLVAVLEGELCAILPGALVSTVARQGGLQARPLVEPVVHTPIGFMSPRAPRPTRALKAALALAADADWLAHAARHSGALADDSSFES